MVRGKKNPPKDANSGIKKAVQAKTTTGNHPRFESDADKEQFDEGMKEYWKSLKDQ